MEVVSTYVETLRLKPRDYMLVRLIIRDLEFGSNILNAIMLLFIEVKHDVSSRLTLPDNLIRVATIFALLFLFQLLFLLLVNAI
jgi:hypothetical protein